MCKTKANSVRALSTGSRFSISSSERRSRRHNGKNENLCFKIEPARLSRLGQPIKSSVLPLRCSDFVASCAVRFCPFFMISRTATPSSAFFQRTISRKQRDEYSPRLFSCTRKHENIVDAFLFY